MSTEVPESAEPPRGRTMTGKAAVRCFLALILSHLGAPYAAARATIHFHLAGHVEVFYAAVAAITMMAGAALAFRQLVDQPRDRRVLYAATCLILWIGVAVTQILIAVDSAIPTVAVGLLWAAGTLWVPWTVWAFSLFRPQGVVAGSLVVIAGASLFWSLVDITGLTGDAKVEFAWRKSSQDIDGSKYEIPNSEAVATPPVWSGYLGNTPNDALTEITLAEDWPANPPEELWRVACGSGWSSFAATETVLFSQEQINGEDCVTARSIEDGQLVWATSEKRSGFTSGLGGNGPRATPTIYFNDNGDQTLEVLLTMGPTGMLSCLDVSNGNIIWKHDLAELFPGENLVHGVCGSPLIVDDKVVVSPPTPDGPCLIAYQVSDGSLVWKTNASWRASYASAALMNIAGKPQIVLHATPGVLAVDPDDGQQLWQFEWTNEWDNNATQPLQPVGAQDSLVIATGYRGGAVRLKLNADRDGTLQPTETWKTTSTLKTKFCNMTQFGDVLVSLNNGILCGVDINNGEELWKNGRYGHGQLLQVGSHLLVVAERGTLNLLKPDEKGHHPLASYPALDRKTWNHPVLLKDRLVVRNDQEIVCLKLKLAK